LMLTKHGKEYGYETRERIWIKNATSGI
jgi:hypothetical protein